MQQPQGACGGNLSFRSSEVQIKMLELANEVASDVAAAHAKVLELECRAQLDEKLSQVCRLAEGVFSFSAGLEKTQKLQQRQLPLPRFAAACCFISCCCRADADHGRRGPPQRQDAAAAGTDAAAAAAGPRDAARVRGAAEQHNSGALPVRLLLLAAALLQQQMHI